ncbi:MAG: hypothetical protein QM733_22245 [Ilumatobacteraceae bacterium]
MSKAIFTPSRGPALAAWAIAVSYSSSRYVALDQPAELEAADELDGGVEVLSAVGVAAGDAHLAVPQAGEVDADRRRHADEHHLATGGDHLERLLE